MGLGLPAGFALTAAGQATALPSNCFDNGTPVDVAVKGDRVHGANEAFFLLLRNPTRASVATPSGTGEIVNDD